MLLTKHFWFSSYSYYSTLKSAKNSSEKGFKCYFVYPDVSVI